MTIRQALEQAEHQRLDPRAAFSDRSRGRPVPEPEREDDVRTCYQRDTDRIVHSKAFRRLMHKTQVFLCPEGDHYRTRMTHTLEVARIARTITRALNLNEDLTEAIALGHDLGHTPFGHAGEDALSQVLGKPFRHNEQSLRVVDILEKDGQGLNLSHEVRLGILGHTGEYVPETLEGHSQPVSKITIVPHTSGALGYTMQMPEEEKYLSTRDELLVELRTLVGGRAAEEVAFGVQTTGAANDIQRATDLARRMVAQFGMSSRFGPMALATVQNEYLEGQSYMDCSQTTAAQMDQEVQSILAQVLADAKKLLSDHRSLLDEVALYLLTKETITGDELMRYVNANQTAQPATVSQDPAED